MSVNSKKRRRSVKEEEEEEIFDDRPSQVKKIFEPPSAKISSTHVDLYVGTRFYDLRMNLIDRILHYLHDHETFISVNNLVASGDVKMISFLSFQMTTLRTGQCRKCAQYAGKKYRNGNCVRLCGALSKSNLKSLTILNRRNGNYGVDHSLYFNKHFLQKIPSSLKSLILGDASLLGNGYSSGGDWRIMYSDLLSSLQCLRTLVHLVASIRMSNYESIDFGHLKNLQTLAISVSRYESKAAKFDGKTAKYVDVGRFPPNLLSYLNRSEQMNLSTYEKLPKSLTSLWVFDTGYPSDNVVIDLNVLLPNLVELVSRQHDFNLVKLPSKLEIARFEGILSMTNMFNSRKKFRSFHDLLPQSVREVDVHFFHEKQDFNAMPEPDFKLFPPGVVRLNGMIPIAGENMFSHFCLESRQLNLVSVSLNFEESFKTPLDQVYDMLGHTSSLENLAIAIEIPFNLSMTPGHTFVLVPQTLINLRHLYFHVNAFYHRNRMFFFIPHGESSSKLQMLQLYVTTASQENCILVADDFASQNFVVSVRTRNYNKDKVITAHVRHSNKMGRKILSEIVTPVFWKPNDTEGVLSKRLLQT